MAELERRNIGKSLTITVSLGNFQNVKVESHGQWDVTGDSEISEEQQEKADLELAVEVKKCFMRGLSEFGKDPQVAIKFFETCREKTESKKIKKQEEKDL